MLVKNLPIKEFDDNMEMQYELATNVSSLDWNEAEQTIEIYSHAPCVVYLIFRILFAIMIK